MSPRANGAASSSEMPIMPWGAAGCRLSRARRELGRSSARARRELGGRMFGVRRRLLAPRRGVSWPRGWAPRSERLGAGCTGDNRSRSRRPGNPECQRWRGSWPPSLPTAHHSGPFDPAGRPGSGHRPLAARACDPTHEVCCRLSNRGRSAPRSTVDRRGDPPVCCRLCNGAPSGHGRLALRRTRSRNARLLA